MKTTLISISNLVESLAPEIRSYKHDGRYYVFRDRLVGDKVYQCQYGVLDGTKSDKSILWYDCEEGARFSQVEPFVEEGIDRYALRGRDRDWPLTATR